MRVAVDAMGGDHAPHEIVAGAVRAAETWPDTQLFLVGQQERIESELSAHRGQLNNIEIVHAPEVVEMDDSPTLALRRKKHSSIKYGVDLVKEGRADGFVTAGNTGAMVGFCTFGMGRLPRVSRAALVAPIPSETGIFALLDVGANVTCTAEQLNQFAMMATIYIQEMAGVKKPRVGLLNIGTEESKGTELIKESHKVLSSNKAIEYIGYIEGNTIFKGGVDVVVTDGFLGNTVLKISEGVSASIVFMVKKAMRSSIQSIIGAALSRKAFAEVKRSLDVSEYGGAMLLGLQGIAIKCHGRADANAIFNGINVARTAIGNRMNEQIENILSSEETVSGKP